MIRARSLFTFAAVAGIIAASVALVIAYTSQPAVASAQGITLTRTGNGLLVDQPFDRALPLRDIADSYEFNGSATPGTGYVNVTGSGLKVGVRAHPDRFEGWFAVTTSAYPEAGVYHVDMAKPAGNVQGGNDQGEAVFAVQTGTTKRNGLINYVVVASNSTHGVTSWLLGYSHGHVANARLEKLQASGASPSAATKLGVTLRTDGRRRLEVWIGWVKAFDSGSLDMNIAPPYQPYLEVQSRRIPYESSFQNFWVTSSDNLTVDGLDAGDTVDLLTPTGADIASARAVGSSAHLSPPLPECRGRAWLVVHRPGGPLRLGPFTYSCGDSYSLG